MDHAHRTSLGLIAAACCLATCLSGCLQPPLGQRVYGEHNCQSGCGPLCKLQWVGQRLFGPHRWAAQPEGEVVPLLEGQMHEAVAVDTCDQGPVYPEDECESCGGPLAGLRCRLCSSRGRLRGLFHRATTVEYYNHPRFHPVPTRPVFQASFDPTVVDQTWMSPAASPTSASGSLPNPPPLMEVNPPPMPSTPEKIRTPDPEPSRNDRLTHEPQRPVKRRPPSSWIFQPSTAPSGQAARQARAYPTAKGWTQTF